MIDYSTYDDQALMRVISGGDGSDAAFSVLYNRYAGSLYKNIFRLTKDVLTTQEIIQDVFERFWKARERIDADQGIDNYLFISARNAVYDHQRKVIKDRTLLSQLQHAAQASFTDDRDRTAEDILQEQLGLLRRAIDNLPPQRKRVFELCRIEGKSYREVCEELGLSMGTVKDHMAKGQKSVRDYLSGHGEVALILIVLLDSLAD
ncbi:MAG: sigma-70 family RNA polymerase sigma factor [Bacteroidota bacterium]